MKAHVAYGNSVFEPEVMLPEQFFSVSADSLRQPERRLMLAVLEDAVLTLRRYAGDTKIKSRRLVRDVERWIEMRNTDWPFSFESICAVLNLDAAALREGLRRLQRRDRGIAPARVLPFALSRRVSGPRHRVTSPRVHRRVARSA